MSGHQVLILTKRVEHCRIIKEKLPAWGDLIYHADGEDPTRNDTLLEMRSGEKDFKILIGTLSLLSAGFDVPSLDCLIFAGDLKSDVTVQQSAGRILRLFEGKESAKIYDLFDSDNPILRRQGYERQNFYKSQNWEMKI
jgi:superfamily II DNA or RNA helicase